MKNNLRTDTLEVDLSNYLRKILKEKILIFSISIICGFLIFFYALYKEKEIYIDITIKDPPQELFEPYVFKFDISSINSDSQRLREKFISEFNDQILSIDNLVSYVEQNKEINNFKQILKNKNMSLFEYFKKKRLENFKEKNKIIPNKFILVLPEGVNGNFFLGNYVEFTKSKSILEFKKKLKLALENNIIFYESARILSEKNQSKGKPVHESNYEKLLYTHLFRMDTDVLLSQILITEELIKKLDSDKFNYNHILEKPYTSSLSSWFFSYLSFLAGLIFGFFLSLVIIFVKNTFKEK
jgi:LPS O-antigen subunit length determinant protein (WzzB/FepE family)